MRGQPAESCVAQQRPRVKQHGLSDHDEQHSEIHGIADMAVQALDDEFLCRGDRGRRAVTTKRESPRSPMAKKGKLAPIHPGEVLREDFMEPLGLSANRLAMELRVPVTRIADLIRERRAIIPDTALRLGRFFNTTARYWLNLQAAFDLESAEDELRDEIERDVRPMARAASSPR